MPDERCQRKDCKERKGDPSPLFEGSRMESYWTFMVIGTEYIQGNGAGDSASQWITPPCTLQLVSCRPATSGNMREHGKLELKCRFAALRGGIQRAHCFIKNGL